MFSYAGSGTIQVFGTAPTKLDIPQYIQDYSMDWDVHREVPDFYSQNDDTSKFLDLYQFCEQLQHQDIDLFVETMDYENAPMDFIAAQLIELGWRIAVELTDLQKRKLVKYLQYINQQKGSKFGIIFIVFELMGIVIEIVDGEKDGFILNFNSLGVDTFLGYSAKQLNFIVISPTLTAKELVLMTAIVDYMRWGVTTYVIDQA